jgi:hypothetical protein
LKVIHIVNRDVTMLLSTIAFSTSAATYAFTQAVFNVYGLPPLFGMRYFGLILVPGLLCLISMVINFSRCNNFITGPRPSSGALIFSIVGLLLSIATVMTIISERADLGSN